MHLLLIPGPRPVAQVQATGQVLDRMAVRAPLLVMVDVLPLVTITRDVFAAVLAMPVLARVQAVACVGAPEETAVHHQWLARCDDATMCYERLT